VELFLQEVRQLIVARQAEVDQHGLAALADHDVARLHVVVNDVLAMDVVQRGGDLRADVRNALRRERRFFKHRQQRGAGDSLHHDVGLRVEARRRDERRRMRT
jgi:hypothetical protein